MNEPDPLTQPSMLQEVPNKTVSNAEGFGEPIQPAYRTRMGQPICPDCNRVRCICQQHADYD